MTTAQANHPAMSPDVHRARRHALADVLSRSAARFPAKLAVVHRDRRLTFAELEMMVNRVANGLAAHDVHQGDRAAILSHNSLEFIVAYFALARLGAISVPINFMLTPEEVAYILGDCSVRAVLVEPSLIDVMDRAVAEAPEAPILKASLAIDHAAVDDWVPFSRLAHHPDEAHPDVDVRDDDPIQLMYTSGTESRPKGAIMTSRSLITQYVSTIVAGEMTQHDVELHSLPLYHCAQLHCFLTPDVYLGATSIVLDRPDPTAILEAIQRERVTKLFCPPTVWISLLRDPLFDKSDLSALTKGYYGASVMPTEVLRELAARLPSAGLYNFYGQTEVSPLATCLGPADQLERLGSCGKPVLNVETRVVDANDVPVPAGTVGEIVHRTPHAMNGYWGNAAKTADAFRDGWFHSGDLGVFDGDGFLTVVDRKKDMIKTGGENVASREVEEVIYGHPAVSEVAVFGVPHPRWIEAVVAVVVLRAATSATADEIRAHARANLAGFKTPKSVAIVDALPKNASGKILKRELRQQFANRMDVEADDSFSI